MITVTVLGGGQSPIGFKCQGHAAYDNHGYDIVCAGVSALTITCANALENIVGCPMVVKNKDGLIEVRILEEASETQISQGNLLIRAMVLGLESIAEEYPKHVRVVV